MNIKLRNTIIFCLIAMFIGFMLGKYTFVPKTEIKIKESVKYVPSPYVISSNIPNYELIPYRVSYPDTIIQYIKQEVDTAEILKDYFLSRQYELDFSNDSIGTFKVNAEVNQNRLVSANSFIQPITKFVYKESTITEQTVRTFQPWVMIGTDVNLDCQQITFGFDLKQKYILGVSGLRVNNKYNYTFNFGLKF